jgi:hypothetical protein
VLDDGERAWLRATLRSPGGAHGEPALGGGPPAAVGIAEGRDREGEVLWRAEDLRDLMLAGGVDSYVSGHQAAFYAGRWGGLELLFAGGVGARRLLGSAAAPRSVVAVVDIAFDPLDVRITAIDPADPARRAEAAAPKRIEAFGGLLTRSPRWAD